MQNNFKFIDFWYNIKLSIKNCKWKNEKPLNGTAYKPTNIEHFANIISHGLWIIPAILASFELLTRSTNFQQFFAATIYGISLILLFLTSTIFHCFFYCNCNEKLTNIFHRFDRAMIYIFIAANYFQWLYLNYISNNFILEWLQWINWKLMIIGIVYQQIYHERYKNFETCLYLLIGIGPFIIMNMSGYEFQGTTELQIGGLIYVLGVGFFKSDGIIPFAHAIWHLFVGFGAAVHYFAILNNLYPKII